MTAQPRPTPPRKMTVDEFLAWALDRPGRHELVDGEVVAMAPERVRHALVKASAHGALRAAVARAGVPCHAMPDGMTVRIGPATAFEPDALVYCGPRADLDAVEIPDPVIVVEVLSPSTRSVDAGFKLAGYFELPSLAHYLMVDPVRRRVVHHRRGAGGVLGTEIVAAGALDLTPPGLSLPVAELFADLPQPGSPQPDLAQPDSPPTDASA